MRTKSFIILVTVLIAILIILQIIHSVLLQRLDDYDISSYEEPSISVEEKLDLPEVEAERLLSRMAEALRGSPVLDGSGRHRVVHHLLEDTHETERDVTLAAHASVESLTHLPTTIQQWEGPVSVAVFVTSDQAEEAVLRLLALRLCSPGVLSLHLVTPVGVELTWPGGVPARSALCRLLDSPPPARSYQLAAPYPNNLLRNVARRAARTQFVLSLDADMAPNVGLRRQFVALAGETGLWSGGGGGAERVAFVLPLYEIGRDVTPPQDKAALLELRRRWPQLIRPFYSTLCAKCQAPTDYRRWEAAPPAGRLAPLYDAPWLDPWEPVYILRSDAPLYDPRFAQFGFNRISHACELHVAGYTYRVLGDGFVLHMGLKGEEAPRPEQQVEQDKNRILFRQFKQELKERYPESNRRC